MARAFQSIPTPEELEDDARRKRDDDQEVGPGFGVSQRPLGEFKTHSPLHRAMSRVLHVSTTPRFALDVSRPNRVSRKSE